MGGSWPSVAAQRSWPAEPRPPASWTSARAVLPGFGDSHVHLVLTGLGLLGAGLGGCRTLDDSLAALADLDDARLGPRVQPRLPGRGPPAEVDRVAPDRVVFLVDRGHHACYANTAALRALAERDPALAGADRDGTLVGTANTRAKTAFAGLVDPAIRIEAIRAARRQAAGVAITHLHALDGGWSGPDDSALILDEARRPGPRITIYEQVTDVEQVRRRGLPRIGGDVWLDGGLYQCTAAFHEPYADEPSTRGLLYYPDDELFPFVEAAHRAGLQVAMHAIGDRAIDQALDADARAQGAYPRPDSRHRVEHFSYGARDQYDRAAALGIVLSMQPNVPFTWEDDERMTTRYLGPERARLKSQVRWALDAGALVAGGSDADVRPMHPLWGIQYLVADTRDGRRVTLDEALRIYTLNPSAAAFAEGETGSLVPGKQADLVILDADPAAVEPTRIKDVPIVATLVGGQVVWGRLDDVATGT